MKEKLLNKVRENTKEKKYQKNTASELGKELGFSRNWMSQYLNEYFNEGKFIKINSRPVMFLDKDILEKEYRVIINDSIFLSLTDLFKVIDTQTKKDFHKLIGYAGSLHDVVEKCKASMTYPPHGLPTLLYGPTGTGKSTIVKLMYEYGKDNNLLADDAQFIHVNCSEYANNPELITANLFGYKKGAFTGADSDNIGMIKAAEGGILFLDEVHCLKPECQEKLFLFMDNGSFRMLGDNEHIYHSEVLLVFATTEKPEEVLLKTLLRRIPVRIEIPSLEERGIKEKNQMIVDALEKEAKKLRKEISISNTAFNSLLHAKYAGNAGELLNAVQTTCMNALFHNRNEETIEIHTLDLPGNIISHQHLNRSRIKFESHHMFSLSELIENISNQSTYIKFFEDLLSLLNKLQNNQLLMQEFIEKCTDTVEKYINSIIFEDNDIKSPTNTYILNSVNTVVEMVSEKYGYTFYNNEINSMSFMIREYSKSYIEMEKYFDSHNDECLIFISIIEKKFMREYMIVTEISNMLKIYLDIELHSFIIATLTLVIHMYHKNRDINKRIGIILAHGYATASSIASAANQMLDQYIFDSIDMPLDTSTETIVNKLNDFLKKRGEIKDLVLLVDMGSLVDIYKGIINISQANIAIANNVNTKMALIVGDALRKDVPLKKIFDIYKEQNEMSFQLLEGREKEKVILCSCATGIGTAEKLKQILEDSLPKDIAIKVLTYDYSTLLKTKLEDDFFDNYEVICIVGTLDPHIENIKFIPVEELIISDSFDILTKHFNGLIDDESMEMFRKNILKNFSLSNIIENLTILNPDKLLEHVAEAIDKLQKEMNVIFSYNTCFGLYVHICCLIERLVTREGTNEYKMTYDQCDKEMQEFINLIKITFSKVEKYYKVEIPVEEIEYIKIYIDNFQ